MKTFENFKEVFLLCFRHVKNEYIDLLFFSYAVGTHFVFLPCNPSIWVSVCHSVCRIETMPTQHKVAPAIGERCFCFFDNRKSVIILPVTARLLENCIDEKSSSLHTDSKPHIYNNIWIPVRSSAGQKGLFNTHLTLTESPSSLTINCISNFPLTDTGDH